MKILRNIIIVMLGCLIVSCNDYLVETSKGKITNEFSFSSPSDLEGSVNVLYRNVRGATFGLAEFTFAMFGDELSTHKASNKAAFRQWDMYSVSSNNDRLQYYWDFKYVLIKSANYIINGVEKTPDVSQANIDYALGQAHFWRAWAYFMLVRPYGPLPLMLSSTEYDPNMPLSTVEEVYEVIVKDLEVAEQKLLVKYEGVPRVMNGRNVVASKPAAQALLANVYLTMAGWPLKLGQEYYQKAAQKALEFINAPYDYTLYEHCKEIHSKAENKKNMEMIIGSWSSTAFGTGDNEKYRNPGEASRGCINDIPDSGGGGWSDTQGEVAFYVNMLNRQGFNERFQATYSPWTNIGGTNYYRWWDTRIPPDVRAPYFIKTAYVNVGSAMEYDHKWTRSDQNNGWDDRTSHIIRLAEVYLWYAEAVGRAGMTSDYAKARELLNIVRNRADGFGAVATRPAGESNVYVSEEGADLAEAAFNEHGWEVAGGHFGAVAPRAADLQRMERLEQHFNARKLNLPVSFTDPYTYEAGEPVPADQTPSVRDLFGMVTGDTWSMSKMFVPYPLVDININPNLDIPVEKKLQMIKK